MRDTWGVADTDLDPSKFFRVFESVRNALRYVIEVCSVRRSGVCSYVCGSKLGSRKILGKIQTCFMPQPVSCEALSFVVPPAYLIRTIKIG